MIPVEQWLYVSFKPFPSFPLLMQNWPCEAWLGEDGLVGMVWKNGQLLLAVSGQQQGILLSKLLLLQPLCSFSLPHLLQPPPSLGTHISAPCTTYCIFCLCVELDLHLGSLFVASVSGSQQHKGFCVYF